MSLSKTLIFHVKHMELELIRALANNPEALTHEIKQLSDIDDQQGLRIFPPIIFFYPPSLEGARLEPAKTIRDGLAKALQTYYPLAGRIFEGPDRKLMIDCNNEGVVFVEAEANVKLEQLGDAILPPCPFADKLVCDVPSSGTIIGSPLLFFQVTRFLCGGFSVGILLNHPIADSYGLMQFLKAIGELVKGASTPSVQPVWEREFLSARSPPKITCIHNEYDRTFSSNKPLAYPLDTFIHTSVVFGPKEIQALRSQTPTPRFSTFDMITACLWKCRTIALEPHPNETVLVSVVANLRYTKGTNIPRGYYGNAIAWPAAISKAGVLCSSPYPYALELVHRAKLEMSEEYMKSVADLMVMRGRPNYVETWNFMVSDIRKLGFDKLDLGWGKPSFGGSPCATPVISIYNNVKNVKGEEGVVVSICLPSLSVDKFQYELMKMTRQPNSKL